MGIDSLDNQLGKISRSNSISSEKSILKTKDCRENPDGSTKNVKFSLKKGNYVNMSVFYYDNNDRTDVFF